MKMFPLGPQSSAEDQAALWAARLDGSSLMEADRAALTSWLDTDPSHRTLLSQYCQFSADLEEQLPALVAAGMVSVQVARPKKRSRWVIAALAGTALAAAAAAAISFRAPRLPTQFENIATSVAKRQTLFLADGTKVELNAQTSIAIEAGRTERRVRLAGGEAFFSVKKDPARPFIVETPAGSVRVTGTKFNVHTEPRSALEVTVVEGSVQVRPGELFGTASAPVSLSAGDQLNAGKDGVSIKALSATAMQDALAWRQGEIVFENVPLSEALNRFAHYHGRGITASPEAGSLRVGGRYSLDDMDGFFAGLEEMHPVEITRDLSGTVRVSLRPAGAASAK